MREVVSPAHVGRTLINALNGPSNYRIHSSLWSIFWKTISLHPKYDPQGAAIAALRQVDLEERVDLLFFFIIGEMSGDYQVKLLEKIENDRKK